MEIATTPPCNVLRTLTVIGKKFKTKKYRESLLNELDEEFRIVSEYLEISKREALIFSIIFWLSFNDRADIDLSDISRFLECDLIEVMLFQPDIDHLIQKRILLKERNGNSRRIKSIKYDYSVNCMISDAILNNESIPNVSAIEPIDIYQFVKSVSDFIDKRKKDDLTTGELFDMVELFEEENQHLSMVDLVLKKGLEIQDRTLWYEICDDLIIFGKTGIDNTLTDIYKNVRQRLQRSRELIEKKNKLFELDWIELEEGGFLSDAMIVVSEIGRDLFLGEDAVLFLKKGKENKLITPEKIVVKTLFFDENLESQVNFIRQSLDQTMFVNLQSRLEAKGLPKGMSVIFYGGPGTGKTESVYQLARQTGRSILHVDISQSKSMWFGESEKRIKEIFTNYKALCKTESLKPILLFNEADAIFGKRKDNNTSSVAQTENAIQNIILEEMEKLDGILIATTNLNKNLDAAFERRFLFKVQFERPTMEAKQKIWQSKIDWLSEAEAGQLATNYSFSGGEIENIVRKATMEEVLTSEKPTFDQLMTYCDNEKFSSTSGVKKLGFQ